MLKKDEVSNHWCSLLSTHSRRNKEEVPWENNKEPEVLLIIQQKISKLIKIACEAKKNFPGHMNYELRMTWLKTVAQGVEGPKLHHKCFYHIWSIVAILGFGVGVKTKVKCPILTSRKYTWSYN